MSCDHDCVQAPVFPAVIVNRPGLAQVHYRIGDYASFRTHMLGQLNQQRALAAWTHREPDDPGIALLEGAALLAEILAFYQELYANEAWLRTAHWPESVRDLVALTGYRLAPGVGGEATFSVTVDGSEPVTIPMGFGFKAQLKDLDEASVLESMAETVAYPALNEFRLYRPRLPLPAITVGLTSLELHAVDGAEDLATRQTVEFNPGDRVMLVPDSAMFDADGGTFDLSATQARSEILVLQEVETVLDRIILRFEGALRIERGTTIRAYKIDRTFRHFGHNAPRTIGKLNETTGLMAFEATEFTRLIYGDHTFFGDDVDFYSSLPMEEMPFDTEVDDLAAGGKLICQGEVTIPDAGSGIRVAVVREIEDVRADTLVWGGLSGACTVATLTERLIANLSVQYETADLRRLQFHEVTSPELTLRAPSEWTEGTFDLDTTLAYYGTYADAVSLAGRDLLLADPDGDLQSVRVMTAPDEFDLTGRDETNSWLWLITLDQPPRFDREAFDESANTITVFGNLVPVNQGETQAEATLGSGDARQTFQTFELSKSPLTYFLAQDQSPAQAPELQIYVEGILYQRIDTFFGAAAEDRVYVVREDTEGSSFVQFGDGKTGARLPSGKGNVVAKFRSGVGARGVLEPDTTPSALGKLKQLKSVALPGEVVGGADAETEDLARNAAPVRMQSLGRLVGLADYEVEALMLPGVLKARADFIASEGIPRLRLVVLTENGTEAEAAEVDDSMEAANRCRGARRFRIRTIQGIRQFVHVDLTVGYAPDRRAEDLEPLILAALGVTGEEGNGIDGSDGLFGVDHRGFGQGAHVSQIIAAAQNIDGVGWVRVDAFQAIPPGDPPETDAEVLSIPDPAVREESLACAAHALLTLHTHHLNLSLSQMVTAAPCDA